MFVLYAPLLSVFVCTVNGVKSNYWNVFLYRFSITHAVARTYLISCALIAPSRRAPPPPPTRQTIGVANGRLLRKLRDIFFCALVGCFFVLHIIYIRHDAIHNTYRLTSLSLLPWYQCLCYAYVWYCREMYHCYLIKDHAEHEGIGGGRDHPPRLRRGVRLCRPTKLPPHPGNQENSRIVPCGSDLRHHGIRGSGCTGDRGRYLLLLQSVPYRKHLYCFQHTARFTSYSIHMFTGTVLYLVVRFTVVKKQLGRDNCATVR